MRNLWRGKKRDKEKGHGIREIRRVAKEKCKERKEGDKYAFKNKEKQKVK